MSLYQSAKQAQKRRRERAAELNAFHPTIRLHEGVRDLSALGVTPEDASDLHPAVGFLLRTGLFDPEVCVHVPEWLNDEFTGGSSRFAAVQDEE